MPARTTEDLLKEIESLLKSTNRPTIDKTVVLLRLAAEELVLDGANRMEFMKVCETIWNQVYLRHKGD